jgi:hypothetical protein
MGDFLIAVGVVWGLAMCFAGYRLFKFMLGVTGFFVFGAIGALVLGVMIGSAEVGILLGLVCAVLGAFLMVKLYQLGVFLTGAMAGSIVGAILSSASSGEVVWGIVIFCGLVAGVLAVIFQKLVIVLSTAFEGSWTAISGIAFFVGLGISPIAFGHSALAAGGALLVLLGWLALGIIGSVVQYKTTKQPSSPSNATASPAALLGSNFDQK